MAQKYCVRKKTTVLDKKKFKYYAVPVLSGVITTKKLSKVISDRCTATESDILAVLNALSAVAKKYIADGYKVRLMDIGDLYLSISSPGFDNPNDCTNSKVFAKRICFKANKELKEIFPKMEFEQVR